MQPVWKVLALVGPLITWNLQTFSAIEAYQKERKQTLAEGVGGTCLVPPISIHLHRLMSSLLMHHINPLFVLVYKWFVGSLFQLHIQLHTLGFQV